MDDLWVIAIIVMDVRAPVSARVVDQAEHCVPLVPQVLN